MSADSPAVIIFDDLGNPVGIHYDGAVYRLQVETTITDGTTQLGTITNPFRIDPVGQTVQPVMGMLVAQGNAPVNYLFKGYPVVISGIDSNNRIQIPRIDGYALSTRPATTTTTTVTSVSSDTVSVNLLPANSSRRGATIYNASTSVLYVLLGSNASATTFTTILSPSSQTNAYYEVPFSYTGNIDGYWQSSNGFASVSEFE